ncbi:MAG: glycosyltransferase family 4 protein [Phycisphaerales bacterium]|jgi:glycosyltransferase involved in cell wall biosynthesis|nr:glycosyltransferase family 4 protein [Phycisphaerales bacterium]
MSNKKRTLTEPADDQRQMRVVILNHYYAPDVASSGHLLFELAEEIARLGADTSVVTCRPSYGPPESWQKCPRKEIKNGVKTLRMNATRFSKDSIIGRLVNITSFLVPLTLFHVLPKRKGKVFLYTTNPPFLGFVGGFSSFIFKHNYAVLLHDAYPDIAVWLGKIKKNGFIDRFWHWCNKFMYNRAKQVIVLSEAAKDLVINHYGTDPDRIHVIPNWADPNELKPMDKRDCNFAKKHGTIEPFTLMYSGNLGLYYKFDMILDAAEKLKNDNFKLIFTGAGGQRDALAQQIKERNLTNTLLLGYTPQEEFNDALGSCDCLMVSIADGIDGISFPSKLYTCLSIGKPMIAFSAPESELRTKVEGNNVGYWVALDDSEGLVKYVREMMANPDKAKEMGVRARNLLETEYSIQSSGKKYFDVLKLADKGT